MKYLQGNRTQQKHTPEQVRCQEENKHEYWGLGILPEQNCVDNLSFNQDSLVKNEGWP